MTILTRASALPVRCSAIALLFLVGCSGLVGAPGLGGNDDGDGPGPGGGPSGEVRLGPPVVRLLDRDEVRNSIADILGQTVAADALPFADLPITGLADPTSNFIGATDFKRLDEMTSTVAAGYIATLQASTGACADAGAVPPCVQTLISDLGRRLLRRTLTKQEAADYEALYGAHKVAKGHNAALTLVVEAFLQSPHFLYRTEIGDPTKRGTRRLTDFEYASALAFLITRSAPDENLLDAAESGALLQPAEVEKQVARLLATERGQHGVLDFYRRWLQLHRWDKVKKDATRFSQFDAAFKAGAMAETEDLLRRELLTPGGGGFPALFTSTSGLVNQRLAELYGVPVPTSPAVTELDAQTRTGVFSRAAFLSASNDEIETRFLHSGRMMLSQVLCMALPDPPNIPPENVDIEGVSRRENITRRTANSPCSACHTTLNPISFPFDAYDPIGGTRTEAEEFHIDPSGQVVGSQDSDGSFDNLAGMMPLFAQSRQVSECHVTHWLRYALGREEKGGDMDSIEEVHAAFIAGENGAPVGDVTALITALVLSDAFLYRTPSAP